ncbi:erythromycin esterase family protein [Candidatus Pacearchaeota archaeon]|nr:erythromycin esterase family protein [Candidatus Pacearchaeota archaeon]
MAEKLLSFIRGKKLILFGEMHGTNEIPALLSHLFQELAQKEDFTVCLEIPQEFQEIALKDMLSYAQKIGTSGLLSPAYIQLIKALPKNVRVLYIAPNEVQNQEALERSLADTIQKSLSTTRTCAILGNIHASKKKIILNDLTITPAGLLLSQKLKDQVVSILFKPKKGTFYNNGIGTVEYAENDLFDTHFDYVCELEQVSPCSVEK